MRLLRSFRRSSIFLLDLQDLRLDAFEGLAHVGAEPHPAHRLVSRLLIKSASGVLAALRGSTYCREYASPRRLLRPCWTAFLNSLRRLLTASATVLACAFLQGLVVYQQPASRMLRKSAFFVRRSRTTLHVTRATVFSRYASRFRYRSERAFPDACCCTLLLLGCGGLTILYGDLHENRDVQREFFT